MQLDNNELDFFLWQVWSAPTGKSRMLQHDRLPLVYVFSEQFHGFSCVMWYKFVTEPITDIRITQPFNSLLCLQLKILFVAKRRTIVCINSCAKWVKVRIVLSRKNWLQNIKETWRDNYKLIRVNPKFIIACDSLTLLIKRLTENSYYQKDEKMFIQHQSNMAW